MKLFDQLMGKKTEEDPEFEAIVREAKRQVEFNRKIGSIILAFIILIVGLFIHFFWDKPDGATSITVNLTIECKDVSNEDIPSNGLIVNKNVFVIPEGGSVEDLLNKFSEKKEVPVEMRSGEVISISGVEKYQTDNRSWHVSVNDAEVTTPLDDTTLENNDFVRVYYG